MRRGGEPGQDSVGVELGGDDGIDDPEVENANLDTLVHDADTKLNIKITTKDLHLTHQRLGSGSSGAPQTPGLGSSSSASSPPDSPMIYLSESPARSPHMVHPYSNAGLNLTTPVSPPDSLSMKSDMDVPLWSRLVRAMEEEKDHGHKSQQKNSTPGITTKNTPAPIPATAQSPPSQNPEVVIYDGDVNVNKARLGYEIDDEGTFYSIPSAVRAYLTDFIDVSRAVDLDLDQVVDEIIRNSQSRRQSLMLRDGATGQRQGVNGSSGSRPGTSARVSGDGADIQLDRTASNDHTTHLHPSSNFHSASSPTSQPPSSTLPVHNPYSQPIPRSRPPIRTVGVTLPRTRSESFREDADHPCPWDSNENSPVVRGPPVAGERLPMVSRLKMRLRRPWSAGSGDTSRGGPRFAASTDSLQSPPHYQLHSQRPSSSYSTNSTTTVNGGGGTWGWGGLRRNNSQSRLQGSPPIQRERRRSVTQIFAGLISKPTTGTTAVPQPSPQSALPAGRISRVILPNNTTVNTGPSLTLGTMVIRDGKLMRDSDSIWHPRNGQPGKGGQKGADGELPSSPVGNSIMLGNGGRPRLPLPTTMTKAALSPKIDTSFSALKKGTLPSTLNRKTQQSPIAYSPIHAWAASLQRNNSGSGSDRSEEGGGYRFPGSAYNSPIERSSPAISPLRQFPSPIERIPVPLYNPSPVVAEIPQPQTAEAPTSAAPPLDESTQTQPQDHVPREDKEKMEKIVDRCMTIRKHQICYEIWCFLEGFNLEGM
jgi:hypothetical protein